MKTHLLFIPALLLVLNMTVQAQEEKPFSRNQTSVINSDILEEDRQISIYLPDGYNNSKASYPVLYLLDGGTHLQHASGAADYLSGRGIVPDIIVVAIHNIDRSRDFSPVHVDNIPTSGGAEKFLGFLSEELVPYMEKSYRTAGFNILLGHSFGGTFIAYTLLAEPDLFDAFVEEFEGGRTTRAGYAMFARLRNLENAFLQVQEGLVDQSVFISYGWRGNPTYEGDAFRAWWVLRRQVFHPDFVAAFEAEYDLAP